MSIYARPSGSFEATVNGAVTGLVGTITVGIYDGQGGTTTAPTTTGIIESPAGSGVYTATLTAPSVTGQYSVTWFDGTAYAVEDLVVAGSVIGSQPPTFTGALATPEELELRLGITFTDAQEAHAAALLDLATDLVLGAIGEDAAWLAAQDDVPRILHVTCIEAAVRGFTNPTGLRSEQETIGQYSHSQSWTDGTSGMELTVREERACRRAVRGSVFRTVTLETPYSGESLDDQPELDLDDA